MLSVQELEAATVKANTNAANMQRDAENNAEMQSLKAMIQNQSDQVWFLTLRHSHNTTTDATFDSFAAW